MSSRLKFLFGLAVFTITMRLMPYVLTAYSEKIDPGVIFYPWNFMPLTGVCLYAGAYISDRRWSLGLPLMTLLASDLGIWAVTGQFSWAFPSDRWSAYVCAVIAVFMAKGLGSRKWPARAADAFARGVLAEVIFFVVTNFAYFLVQADLPHTPAGLIACYIAALPFAGKSFVSTAFYSVLLFSPLAVRQTQPRTRIEQHPQSVLSR